MNFLLAILLLCAGCAAIPVQPSVTLDPTVQTSAPPALPVAKTNVLPVPANLRPVTPPTVTLGWSNSVVVTNEYTVVKASPTLALPVAQWPVMMEQEAALTGSVILTATNPCLFIVLKNQIGP